MGSVGHVCIAATLLTVCSTIYGEKDVQCEKENVAQKLDKTLPVSPDGYKMLLLLVVVQLPCRRVTSGES